MKAVVSGTACCHGKEEGPRVGGRHGQQQGSWPYSCHKACATPRFASGAHTVHQV